MTDTNDTAGSNAGRPVDQTPSSDAAHWADLHPLDAPRREAAVISRASPLAIGTLLLLFVLIGLSRFLNLGGDPAAWVPDAFITDEGWWADAARGKVLFNDYFADTFGTAYLVTPAYTWILEAIYKVGGVGLIQTRIPAAFFNVMTIISLALLVWRLIGIREALLISALLGISPYFVNYGRIAYQEPTQACFITLSFVLWFANVNSIRLALASGLAMGMAIAIKPNAIFLGFVPVAFGAIAAYFVQRFGRARNAPPVPVLLLRILLVAVGICLIMSVVYVLIVRPNGDAFWSMLVSESAAKESQWRDIMTIPARALISTEPGETDAKTVVWHIARRSPFISLGVWLYFLHIFMKARASRRTVFGSLAAFDTGAAVWVILTWAVISTAAWHPDRRYVLLMPPMAILATVFVSRHFGPGSPPLLALPQTLPSQKYAIALWFVILLPVLVLLEPIMAEIISAIFMHIPMGEEPGLSYGLDCTLALAVWTFLVTVCAFQRRAGERLGVFVLRRLSLPLMLVAFAYEVASTVHFLSIDRPTLIERQAELGKFVQEGDVVLGHCASTFFQPFPVRTVRRARPIDISPPPNPEVWEKLKPKFLFQLTRRNFAACDYMEGDLVQKGYESIHRLQVGPARNGVPRFELELFRRTTPAPGAP